MSKKLKTIKQHNKEAAETEVGLSVSIIKAVYSPTGLICPCGCDGGELLEARNFIPVGHIPIKCSLTGRTGRMFRTPLRGEIEGVEWNDASGAV